MFEVGATYFFKMVDPFGAGGMSFTATIIRVAGHLIEVRSATSGKVEIFNTAASTFVSAARTS